MTISKGEYVHHPIHGIGHVQSIRERSFSGDTGTTYAKVYFKREELTLMLREQDLAETVRKPIDASEAKKLLNHLESWNGKVRAGWKARANANQMALEGGNPFDYAEVYAELRKLEADGSLRAADRQHMNKSLDLLVEELSNALGKTPEQARRQLASV
ncbi:MAG: hypothetical protein HKN57_01440 [Xanthomonadales bacterium]|nr:hypothetical protein [Gammaproteobacteria bacterium]NND55893.1 hypothetical protein [Xanthomonadales bacterium]NNK50591.1 hypothetical protein [Xanthomonadales bacterium]